MIAIMKHLILVLLVTWLSTGDAIRRKRSPGKLGPPGNINPTKTKASSKMTKKKGSKSVFFLKELHHFLDEDCSIKTKSPTKIPSNDPSRLPSQSPSKTPTKIPSNDPSPSPSRLPSPSPSKTPTKTPSNDPSKTPTKTPSNDPSKTPTSAPSDHPSAKPTNYPSNQPSEFPTSPPSPSPSSMPSKTPSVKPSEPPSESPVLPPPEMVNETCPVLTMECALANGKSCDIPQPVKEECEERPSKMTMIFRGGNCSQSNHTQEDGKFNCQDFQGGPPTKNGDQAYIVVTDVKGKGIVYHSDWVFVGDKFFLQNGNEDFEADQFIKIYSSSDTTENNLLQLVKYHSSCSQNLFLMDTFGASQLVEFYSKEQGLVSSFTQMDYEFHIVIPVTIEGTSRFTIQEFIIETDLPQANIPHNPFYGEEFDSGSKKELTIPAIVDLSISKQYKISLRYVLKTESGSLCDSVALITVTVGEMPPSTFPSQEPKTPPHSGLKPRNPNDPCVVKVDITCILDNGDIGQQCRAITPSSIACTERPSKMTMLFNGGGCSQSNNTQGEKFTCRDFQEGPPINKGDRAYIDLIDVKGKDVVYHSDWVTVGESFLLSTSKNQEFEADQFIYVYRSNNTTSENLLQAVKYHSSCSKNLYLGDKFGSSQLIEWYSDKQGLVSSFASIIYEARFDFPDEVTNFVVQTYAIQSKSEGSLYIEERYVGRRYYQRSILSMHIPGKVNLAKRNTFQTTFMFVLNTDSGLTCTAEGASSFST